MRNKMNWAALIVLLIAASGLGADRPADGVDADDRPGGPPGQPSRVFYPPPPDPPRYQFLLSFSDAAALGCKPVTSLPDPPAGTAKKAPRDTSLVNPYGIAVRDGKIYVCDLSDYRLSVFDLEKRQYRVLGDGKNLIRPISITIAPDGTRYVCDMAQRLVAVFDADDKFVKHLGDPKRCGPADVAVHGDELFVVDQPGGKIEVWSKTGELKRTISQPGKKDDQLERPANIAVGPDGQVYVADTIASKVKVFDKDGKFVRDVGGPGDTPGNFARPKGLRIDPTNSLLYVADPHFDTVQVFSLKGELLLVIQEQSNKPQGLSSPTGIAIDATSLKYFAKYIDDGFQAESLVFVTNEFGKNKVMVYAYGKSKTGKPLTQPADDPPAANREQPSGGAGLRDLPRMFHAPTDVPASQPAGANLVSIKNWAGFQKTVLQADRPVVVLLVKDPNPTCVIQQDEIEKLAKEFAGRILFARMVIMKGNFEVTCPEVRDAYKVFWVPTTILFVKGEERKRWELNHLADEIRAELQKVAGDSKSSSPATSGPDSMDR